MKQTSKTLKDIKGIFKIYEAVYSLFSNYSVMSIKRPDDHQKLDIERKLRNLERAFDDFINV